MSMVSVDDMYKSFGILADAKEAEVLKKLGSEYKVFIRGVKSNDSVKQLCAEFIPRYFDSFPEYHEHAFNALCDLCEQPATLRQKGLAGLFKVGKSNKEWIHKVAYVITQFLPITEERDRRLTIDYLTQLMNVDAKECYEGILEHVGMVDEGVPATVQHCALEFLASKDLPSSTEQAEIVKIMMPKLQKVLKDSPMEDCNLMLKLVQRLRHFNTVTGTQELVDAIFNAFQQNISSDADRVHSICELAIPLFSRSVTSDKFVQFYVMNFIPAVPRDSKQAIAAYKVLAQLSQNVGDLSDASDIIEKVFKQLLFFLPALPEDLAARSIADEELKKNLHLSCVEPLMFTLHQLGKKHEGFLNEAEQKCDEKLIVLKDFKKRLQYFSQLKQNWQKKFDVTKKKKLESVSITDAEKERYLQVSRSLENITRLIRDLFHSPPVYTSQIKLSWKGSSDLTPGGRPKISFGENAVAETGPATTKEEKKKTEEELRIEARKRKFGVVNGVPKPVEDVQGDKRFRNRKNFRGRANFRSRGGGNFRRRW